jgi:uncharacterized membrane protein
MLVVGLLGLLLTIFTVRRVPAEDPAVAAALVIALAVCIFLSAVGLIGVVTEPDKTPEQREDEELALAEERSAGRGPTVAAAVGGYLLVTALVLAGIVGVAQNDIGAAIQTFTTVLVLGGIIFGVGWLFAYRPVEE